MASEREHQLGKNVAKEVADLQSQQFADLKTQLGAVLAAIQELTAKVGDGGSAKKKSTKSTKSADSATPANGSAETKSDGGSKSEGKTMNNMNYFKQQYQNDADVRKKYWKDEYSAEMNKDDKIKKSLDKKKTESEKYKVQADFIWKNYADEPMKKDWAARAKSAGKGASGSQLDKED